MEFFRPDLRGVDPMASIVEPRVDPSEGWFELPVEAVEDVDPNTENLFPHILLPSWFVVVLHKI